uniref:Protein kinase n=1 Tax=Pithovirus LCPAC406 TaxID=2506599 RepID=A0A481ZFI7_9VIRU|nr:MAG: protein kinase [Pithovirus LCPAC406]
MSSQRYDILQSKLESTSPKVVSRRRAKRQSITQRMKTRKNEVLELYMNNDIIVEMLSKRSPFCDEIGFQDTDKPIKLTKELGQGASGKVWEVRIDNQGIEEYIAVKIPHKSIGMPRIHIDEPIKLESYAEKAAQKHNIDKSLIIKVNGGNKDKILRRSVILPIFAAKCLTEAQTFQYYKNVSEDDEEILDIPKGSYICSENIFSEYLIGILCAELYTTEINGIKSINFIDVLDFSTCPKEIMEEKDLLEGSPAYMFQQKVEGSLCDAKVFVEEDIGPITLQVLHAIECYQRAYRISHNDLSLRNIMYGKTPEIWNGNNIQTADYFEYIIDGTSFYIPASQYVIKIADFGLSVKYSRPMILNYAIIKGFCDIPNFYSSAFDLGVSLFGLSEYVQDAGYKNTIPTLCMHYFKGDFRSKEFQRILKESGNDVFSIEVQKWLQNKPDTSDIFDEDNDDSFNVYKLEEIPLSIMTAANILKSDIFKEYRKLPEGKIVKVGFC